MRAIKDLTQLKLTMGVKEYIEGQLDARLGRIESRFADVETKLSSLGNQVGNLKTAFYVVTGVYSAMLAFTLWHNTQLANNYQTQLSNTTITLTDRIDNLAEKYDAQFTIRDKELKLQEKRIEDIAKKSDSQIEEQRRRTDLLYKKFGLE